MSNDQVQGAADADALPEFKLPTLPSVPRLPTAPRSSEPLPTVPMLSLDDPAGGRSGTATSFQEMLRAHQAQATTSRRRRRRGSPVATFLLMVIVGGALAGAGYLAYDEYRGRNTIDDRLPTFGEVDVPYASFTLRANIEGIDLDATTEAIPGTPAPRPLVMDYTLTWDVLVPEEMLPFVEVESTSTYTTENGRMTTYDLVLDLHGFATEDERGFERWRDDTGFTGDTDVDDFARSGYPISITVDDDGLVWGYTESNAISTTEMRLERVSTEPYAPTVPATWTEDATPIL